MNTACRAAIAPLLMLGVLLAGCSADRGPASGVVNARRLPASFVALHVTPAAIEVGQTATLSWDAANVSKCTPTGAWNGVTIPTSAAQWDTPVMTSVGTYTFDITCVGTNSTASSVAVLIVGNGGAPNVAMQVTPQAIRPGDAAIITWSTTSATACTGSGGTGSDNWAGTQPLQNPNGVSTGPITAAGDYSYTLDCTGPGGSGGGTKILSVQASAPIPAPAFTFTATPAALQPGDSTTLTWNASNAASCTASGGTGTDSWSGAEPVSSTGLSIGPINTAGTYTYTLSCGGPGGSTSHDATIVVSSGPTPPAVSLNMDVTPTSIVAGGSATLGWSSNNATSCTASGSWSGTQAVSGSGVTTGTISTPGTYWYTLTCSGPGGSNSDSATLQVVTPAATVATLSASPASIAVGGSTSIAWTSTNASSCAASGGSGADGWSGTQAASNSGFTVGPLNSAGTYTYTLTCSGGGGASSPSSIMVTVSATPAAASISTFNVAPTSVQVGQSINIDWTTSNATGCTASGGSAGDGWSGNEPASSPGVGIGPINAPGTYTYTLTCTGSGGASTPSSAQVTATAAPPVASVDTFSVSPGSVQVGSTISIAWSSSNATGCTASGGSGADAWTGAEATSSTGTAIGPLNTAGSYTYSLNCTGPGGGSTTQSAAVVVSTAPPAASVDTYTVSPTSITAGQSINIAWSASNATGCTASGGTGSDVWTGSEPASSSGLAVGPLNTAGTYTYTLTCSGTGGASSPSSAVITVAPLPTASIDSFTVSPTSVQVGGSVSLAWSSSHSTGCTASGGASGDGWGGAVGTSSTGTSAGPIASAGTYTYTLTCTGAGGASSPSDATVTVTVAPPVASVDSFSVTPSAIQTGQTLSVTWSSSNATACTASGGASGDGWAGTVGTSSTGTTVGPIAVAGTYTYSLDCTGPGGASTTSSQTITVASPPAATINSFAVSPASVQTGQSLSANWSSSNATGCTPSGGAGADGWTGSLATSSSGMSIGPITTAGTYTYTLTCTGAGGASSPSSVTVTATAPPPGAPTVSVTANGVAAAQIQPGHSFTLAWSTTNSTGCTATGGTGADGWNGSKATSSSGLSIGPIATPGIYSYTLSCSGPGGSSSSTVKVTVITSSSADCGLAQPSTLLLTPAASAGYTITGLCIGCAVSSPGNAVSASTVDYASMTTVAGVGATEALTVTDGTTSYPAGRKAGILLSKPAALLTVGLLSNVSVDTLLNGTVQDSGSASALLTLDAVGLLANPQEGFYYLTTTKPFNAVRVRAASVSVLSTLQVYGACVTLN